LGIFFSPNKLARKLACSQRSPVVFVAVVNNKQQQQKKTESQNRKGEVWMEESANVLQQAAGYNWVLLRLSTTR
jgi:hypothetical protein